MEYKDPHDIERENRDRELYERTGIETYERKLDRWREGWRRELDDDLDNGR